MPLKSDGTVRLSALASPQGTMVFVLPGENPGQRTTSLVLPSGERIELAEDASSNDRAEWQVNGQWYTKANLPANAVRTHWRLRGLNTVLLFSASKTAKVGQTFTAPAPMKPFSVFGDAAKTCADDDDHIGLDQTVYWYRWEPDQTSCKIAKQDLKVTVSKVFRRRPRRSTPSSISCSRTRRSRPSSCSVRSTTVRSPRTRPACGT